MSSGRLFCFFPPSLSQHFIISLFHCAPKWADIFDGFHHSFFINKGLYMHLLQDEPAFILLHSMLFFFLCKAFGNEK